MNNLYWHELSSKEKQKVFSSKITLGEFMDKYNQPSWCGYPEALNPTLGCWTLTDCYISLNEDLCESCDMHKHVKKIMQEAENEKI